jgi:hypothetical protein
MGNNKIFIIWSFQHNFFITSYLTVFHKNSVANCLTNPMILQNTSFENNDYIYASIMNRDPSYLWNLQIWPQRKLVLIFK